MFEYETLKTKVIMEKFVSYFFLYVLSSKNTNASLRLMEVVDWRKHD